MVKRLRVEGGRVAPSEFLSEAQLEGLLAYVKERANLAREKGTTRAIVDELVILLLVSTGLRASELCSLNIADVPPDHGQNAIVVRGAQGNVTRSIEITSEVANCIARFVRLYREGAKPDEPLLISERGKRLIYMSLYSKVKRIGQKAGIGKLHPHMLRHTYVVRLYNAERDLRFVQKQAGHASRKTTALYVGTSGSREQKVETMDTVDSSARKSPDDSKGQTTIIDPAGLRPHGASNSPQDSQQIEICEVCRKSIPAETGMRIDSGQVLCADCLDGLRRSYSISE